MYSLVMLTAFATGADVTPSPAMAATALPVTAGCCGVPVSGCCGYTTYGSCTGCYGSCHGSCHGGLFSGGRGFFSHKHSCHGCSGCTGSSCCGGYGSYGSGMGSTWGPPIGMAPYTLHGYNQGGMYGYGPPVSPYVYGTVTNPNPPTMTTAPSIPVSPAGTTDKPSDTTIPKTMPEKKPSSDAKPTGTGASIKLRLPADSKLYIDGQLITVGGTERVFTTPVLAPGQKFYYDARAELMINGSLVVEEKKLIVEAGANLNEAFGKLFAALPVTNSVAIEK